MVKTGLYLLSEGLALLCVDLIPKSKKLFLDIARGCIFRRVYYPHVFQTTLKVYILREGV